MLLGIAIDTMNSSTGAMAEVFQLVKLALAKLRLVARALISVLVAAGIIQMLLVVGACTDTS